MPGITNTSAEIRAAAEALLGDIEAMQDGDYFGGFTQWRGTYDGDGVMVEWPNLAISIERLRKALDGR